MKRSNAFWLGAAVAAVAVCVAPLQATHAKIRPLDASETAALVGGTQYDYYQLCDGNAGCLGGCVSKTCAAPVPLTAGAVCAQVTPGSSGCAAPGGTQSTCFTSTWWTDCLEDSAPACGGPNATLACSTVAVPACPNPGCAAPPANAGLEISCFNCANVP